MHESEVAQSCPTVSDPWTAAYQASPSMGFSRQEYWSGVPLPSPSVGENVEKIKRLCTVGENVNWCNHYGKQCQSSLNIVLVFIW